MEQLSQLLVSGAVGFGWLWLTVGCSSTRLLSILAHSSYGTSTLSQIRLCAGGASAAPRVPTRGEIQRVHATQMTLCTISSTGMAWQSPRRAVAGASVG